MSFGREGLPEPGCLDHSWSVAISGKVILQEGSVQPAAQMVVQMVTRRQPWAPPGGSGGARQRHILSHDLPKGLRFTKNQYFLLFYQGRPQGDFSPRECPVVKNTGTCGMQDYSRCKALLVTVLLRVQQTGQRGPVRVGACRAAGPKAPGDSGAPGLT